MAYRPENLSALSYANGFTLWHYRTSDAAADLTAPGYFDGTAVRMFRPGDWVMVNIGASNALLTVQSNDGRLVEVAAFVSSAA